MSFSYLYCVLCNCTCNVPAKVIVVFIMLFHISLFESIFPAISVTPQQNGCSLHGILRI
jgi:hypothetical protein